MSEILYFLNIKNLSVNWEKHIFHCRKWNFELVKNVAHTAEFFSERSWNYIYLVYVYIAYSISEWTQETRGLILSLISCSVLFFVFSKACRELSFWMRNMCVAWWKLKRNNPYKHIAYSLAPYYLGSIRSGIWLLRSGDSSVNVASVFVLTIIFCYYIRILLTVFDFLR